MSRRKNIQRLDKTHRKIAIGAVIVFTIELLIVGVFALFFVLNLFNTRTYIIDEGNFYIFLAFLVLFLCFNGIYILTVIRKVIKSRSYSDLSSAELFGSGVDEAYQYGQIGLIVVDNNKDDNIILWANEFILKRFTKTNQFVINQNIRELFKDIDTETSDEMHLVSGNYTYRAKHLIDSGLYIFCDDTRYDDLNTRYKKEATALGLVQIDNYASIDSRFGGNITLMADIRHAIADYFQKYEVYLNQKSEDSFSLVCDAESLQMMEDDRFSILDTIKKIKSESEDYITITIGFASGVADIPKLKNMCSDAFQQGRARGGDQAVVARQGKDTKFIGGKTLGKGIRDNSKTRDEANKVLRQIEDSDEVIIMGHINADLDAFGSAIGIHAMCEYKKKKAHIVFDKSLVGGDVRNIVISEFGLTNEILIDPKDANQLLKEKSNVLLVLTDVSSNNQLMYPKLVEENYDTKIIIIDHHQPGVNDKRIEKTIGDYIDPTASSASEIVANYIHYATANPKIEMSKVTSTFLLAGILLDTDGYRRESTSPSTYEASMFLRESGADNQKAAKLVMGSKEDFLALNTYLSHFETIASDVAYVKVDDNTIKKMNKMRWSEIKDEVKDDKVDENKNEGK